MVFASVAYCRVCCTTLPLNRLHALAKHIHETQHHDGILYGGGVFFWCPLDPTKPKRSLDLITSNPGPRYNTRKSPPPT